MKKFLLMLGGWFVLLLVILAGSLIYGRMQAARYDQTAIPYIKKAITEVSQWDSSATRALMVSEVSSAIPEDKFARGMALFSTLGALQGMDEPEFEEVYLDQDTVLGKQTILEYNTLARYANGEATVNLKLMERDGHLEIYRINFSSTALMK